MNNKIISRHLSWMDKGLHFEDILEIRNDLKKTHRQKSAGTEAIQQRIQGQEACSTYSEAGVHKLKFLIVDDIDFDGNLAFLKNSRNLEALFISGHSSKKKISDLKPLENLPNLKRIHLIHQNIKDISPLASLKLLKELDLHRNELNTIEPISNHKTIEKARFTGVGEGEIAKLLQNSSGAVVTYRSHDLQRIYHGFWINDSAFRACFLRKNNHVSVSVAPIKAENGEMPLITLPENLRNIILRTKDLAGEIMHLPPELENSHFSFVEKSNVLKGTFQFKEHHGTSSALMDGSGSV